MSSRLSWMSVAVPLVALLALYGWGAPQVRAAEPNAAAPKAAPSKAAESKGKPQHRIAIHVDENDPERLAMVLNNLTNLAEYYEMKGESYEVELVAYGPGLHMLRDDTSTVKDRLKTLTKKIPALTLSACENTRQGMKKREGKEIPLISEAHSVPSGVIRLTELQEQGWSYIRP